MKVIHPLEPIFTKNSKILILGTMPSVISRQEKFYYANPQNRFWPVLENIFHVKLLNYEEKINFLNEKNIALWDVIESCEINNSQDSSIKNIKFNDIISLINKTNIKIVFCTGKKAYDLFQKNFSFPCLYLPSPSSANAKLKLNDLIKEYEIILKFL
ncbi:MAG: DNA-deoxyinosine glycosylase [Firmicutes bacterium]|nr:DNA-deoxyinosine glycosylase [Bacillota bacterium]